MEKIVKEIIEKVESFGSHNYYWSELRDDALKELETNPEVSNQNLWLCIKAMAEYMENYVG
jgi:hypothetical protein